MGLLPPPEMLRGAGAPRRVGGVLPATTASLRTDSTLIDAADDAETPRLISSAPRVMPATSSSLSLPEAHA